ncbi:hypothetical protein [Domibacillus epiphyticus]|uniref:hypothetical protein n=1 Tax=Domibacillus epiphyticus TaxID=1714355 RepID=UPI0018E91F33|nr:hypothetical protein [Domibacillus epiphyticus]
MQKLGWGLTIIGFAAILGGILYPLEVISKTTFFSLLIGGACVMFIGSMVRSFSMLRK